MGGAAAGIAIGSAVIGGYQQHQAGKAANRSAKANARARERETKETIKRTAAQQQQELSATRARQGGSGIVSGAGSTTEFLDEMEKTFQEDLDWIQKSGASQASMDRAQGRLAQKQATAAAWGTVASGASSLIGFWS